MKIWISSTRGIIFNNGISNKFLLINFEFINRKNYINKRKKINLERDKRIFRFAIITYNFPSSFISMYYTEDKIKYYHQLVKLVKTIT